MILTWGMYLICALIRDLWATRLSNSAVDSYCHGLREPYQSTLNLPSLLDRESEMQRCTDLYGCDPSTYCHYYVLVEVCILQSDFNNKPLIPSSCEQTRRSQLPSTSSMMRRLNMDVETGKKRNDQSTLEQTDNNWKHLTKKLTQTHPRILSIQQKPFFPSNHHSLTLLVYKCKLEMTSTLHHCILALTAAHHLWSTTPTFNYANMSCRCHRLSTPHDLSRTYPPLKCECGPTLTRVLIYSHWHIVSWVSHVD
jgi:hypothetical protein